MRSIWNEEHCTLAIVSHVGRDGLSWVKIMISEPARSFQETNSTHKPSLGSITKDKSP